ncbi:hypothetical protein M3196_11490 [Fictibacillus nanhaiensis]|jgi:hypothetical protein|nr:hypothetical protein [Fictibacillus nanhaiensis]MCM3732283.1 hypothetical protein [Fictibacillus nanhaiensis]
MMVLHPIFNDKEKFGDRLAGFILTKRSPYGIYDRHTEFMIAIRNL